MLVNWVVHRTGVPSKSGDIDRHEMPVLGDRSRFLNTWSGTIGFWSNFGFAKVSGSKL